MRLHDCRHTFASHAVMSDLDLYTVGRLLGHADTASTERNAHLADGHIRAAAGRIFGIVHDAMTGSGSRRRIRLTVKAIAAAKPAEREYTLWDKLLARFGVRVQPSGVKSWIVQTRVNGHMRKITLGRFPALSFDATRRDGAAALARLWGSEESRRSTKGLPILRIAEALPHAHSSCRCGADDRLKRT